MDQSNHSSQLLSDQAKVKCFGSSAAFCAEATVNAGESTMATINLEVAPMDAKRVEWNRKIVIQLSNSELPLLCSVLLGYLPKLTLKRPNKGIEIQRQQNKVFIRASAGANNLFMLPISIGDTFRLSTLALVQLKRQSGISDDTLILAALRGAASLVNAPKS